MKLAHLVRFSALAEELHFPRAAASLGIPLASLYTTIDKLEEEVGQPLVSRTPPTRLTPAGELLLEEAHARIADAPPQAAAAAAKPQGGKAKASKGKGRAPIVKGQPKPYKKRQGR